MATDFKLVAQAVIEADGAQVRALTQRAVGEGVAAEQILSEGLIAGMDVIGEQFRAGEVFVPEVLLSARAMQEGLKVLRPVLAETGAQPKGTAVVGTIQGDRHDIGKNLVAMMLEGAGFRVIDLGNDVPIDRFVATAAAEQAEVVGISTLLTTTMPRMRKVAEAFAEAKLREKVRLMVGGAPITRDFAEQIGVDGYGGDARAAVTLAESFVAQLRRG